jgi:hypothetical protein
MVGGVVWKAKEASHSSRRRRDRLRSSVRSCFWPFEKRGKGEEQEAASRSFAFCSCNYKALAGGNVADDWSKAISWFYSYLILT